MVWKMGRGEMGRSMRIDSEPLTTGIYMGFLPDLANTVC